MKDSGYSVCTILSIMTLPNIVIFEKTKIGPRVAWSMWLLTLIVYEIYNANIFCLFEHTPNHNKNLSGTFLVWWWRDGARWVLVAHGLQRHLQCRSDMLMFGICDRSREPGWTYRGWPREEDVQGKGYHNAHCQYEWFRHAPLLMVGKYKKPHFLQGIRTYPVMAQ